ncbi:LOW QUALITY PROTEIN: uncharacterized protein LOC111024852 [Momordica charantia]|uniref:LOW QUALITY PROTEIN: uncharacterized protein LOC111024852 n=1 Tax=Momordica charantia TaxID=3673 RepID=A0A6J1DVK5_MOMCH|nr:LOW QUALITY PROTEIN: uncharacterized protein LOC111024852 [Momordica charantia]
MASTKKPFLLLATISATLVAQVCSFFIDFPLATNYDQLATLIWNYDTSVFHGDHVRPPPPLEIKAVANASVRVVYYEKFRLRNGGKTATFVANFVLNLGSETNSPPGNEGVAFILAADPSPPAASEGQWLGIANSTMNGTAEAAIFAIEFDTRKNFPEDVDGNHVGLDLNSVYSVSQKPLSEFRVNLSAMTDVFVRADFDGQNISIYVSTSSRLEDQLKSRVIFHPLNLSVLPDEVYVGFSASKFNYESQLNWIKSWQFSGTDVVDDDDKHHRRGWVWITAVAGGLVFISGVAILCFWVVRKRQMEDSEEAYPDIEDQLQDFSISPRVQKFGFTELKNATGNFDPKNRLGRGGFGTVYRGNLMNKDVAVKRISEDSRQGKQEFIAEVATIGGLHHKNLVKLIGWCYQKRDLLLVYEYMPNGSLDKLIFGGDDKSSTAPNWEIRQNIIYGVAEALDYLHNGCEKTVLHRDVKSSNIMLDSRFEAKLGDFGLARTIRRTEQTHHSTREIAGTPGYMAPEIFLTSRATAETDVYAFGVLVLEVVCGRKPGSPSELGGYDGSLAHWAWEFHKEGKIGEAVDERIEVEGEFVKEEMEYLLILGLACCHPNPLQRPTMRNVLQVLKGEANPPILPNERPSFVWPPMPPSFKEDTDSSLKDSQLAPFTKLSGRHTSNVSSSISGLPSFSPCLTSQQRRVQPILCKTPLFFLCIQTMSSSLATIRILLLATAAFFGCAVHPTRCFFINFPFFSADDPSEFLLSNNAAIFLDALQVTLDVRGASIANESGRVVYRKPFKLKYNDKIASFTTNFEINISPVSSPAGEGMAFILAADASPPTGSYGQWLGIVNASTNGTLEAKILAIEFDTRKNFPQDVDSNHVGLNINGIFSIVQQPLSDFRVNLSSANSIFGIIKYDGTYISVFVSMSNKKEDQLNNLVIFRPLDLSILPDKVFVGFSASTSNYTQLNSVKSWQFYGTDFSRGKGPLWVWLTVAGVVAGHICVAGLAFFFWETKRRMDQPDEPYGGIEDQLKDFSIAPRAQKFGLRELKKATNDFDPKNRLGKGGFGTVYKGILLDKEVAIKRIAEDSRQGKQEFIAEVATIGSLHHKNLVKLTGWCYEKRDLLLVYEYMPNGSLSKLIFGNSQIDGMELAHNWGTRRNIICGVAEASDYLHNGCERTVLHRDIKSSNIMLDSKFEPKLGDFGLARIIHRSEQTHHSTREIAGTPGYMAPEIFLTCRATTETDVYAFGVLILEVMCGRKPGNPSELGGYDGSLAHWAWEFQGKIVEAVDERIEGQFIGEELEHLLILGLACCHPNPLQRTTMRNVMHVLKGKANPPVLPNERPSFVWPPMPPSFREDANNLVKESQLTQFTELTGR